MHSKWMIGSIVLIMTVTSCLYSDTDFKTLIASLEKLERNIRALVEENQRLKKENQTLKRRLETRMIMSQEEHKEVEDLMAKLHDENYSVRINAARKLGEMGEKAAVAVSDLLVASVKDEDEYMRHFARKAIEEMGGHAIPPLVAAKRDKSPKVREAAGEALAKIRADLEK